MTWYPISFLPTQYSDNAGAPYSGAVLKAYAETTSTVIPMATDYNGLTTATSFALNSLGFPVSDANAVIIPHIQENYKIALYPDQASADANSGAVWTVDKNQIADAVSTAFLQAFSGDGSTTDFILPTVLGTDEKTLMVFADRIREYSTNGNFASDASWTKGAGWSISAGVATAAGAISTDLDQDAGITIIEGESYTVTFTVVNRSAGGIIPKIGGVQGTERTANGTYSETIIAGSTQKIAFEGNGYTGDIDDVSVTRVNSSHREILRNDEFTLDGISLTFNEAPSAGTNNILVFAPSLLLGEAAASAAAAAISEANAASSETLAEQWASKTDGIVDSTDYSSKAWSIGGTDVTDTATRGAAKEWATKAEDSTVDGTEYSAKHYSAKSSGFATNSSNSASAAAASAAAAASSAAEGLYKDVVTLTNADSPYTPSLAEEGTLFLLDMSSGAITVDLSTLATYGEDMKLAFAKVDGTANNGTVNRGGSDTIDGGTSITLSIQYVVNVVVGDSSTGSWLNAIQSQSIADGSITFAKLNTDIMASQAQAEAGTASDKLMTPERTAEAIAALAGAAGRIINVQAFSSSGTYTRTAGVGKAIVILSGATGGGSANSTNNGTAGGTTSFGSFVSCTGGAGGTLKTVDNTLTPATAGSPTGHLGIIGDRRGGAGASGYDGGGQWRFGQPGGHAPVVIDYITPGSSETVTIGAAGVGGAAGAEAGENGLEGYIIVIELE